MNGELSRRSTTAREAYLLEVMSVPGGARVSFCPVHSAATATLRGYEPVAIDHAELQRLTYELKVLLGRVNMRGQLDSASSAEVRKLGHLLFDELLPPSVKTLLREREGHDLLVRTDEPLIDIPWELLHTGEQFLALRWNIGRLLSASDPRAISPVTPRPLKAPYNGLILADPCGDLDAAYEEGLGLHSLLDGQMFLDVSVKSSEISRAYLRENIREVDILHFAGHAEVGGHGDGWLLSDGRFTHLDIERLAGGRPFPSLIFANACGSGRGGHKHDNNATSEATTSLARTFIGAGVRHFIGAHWDVPDTIANTFASHFYRSLCDGHAIGHALRHARLALSVAYGDGTILWGSYCLYGDPSFVYFPEANTSSKHPSNLSLPIVDNELSIARGIYHTIDLPVGDLLEQASETSSFRPYPEMRNESVLDIRPSRVSLAVTNIRRTLTAICMVSGALLLAVFVHEGIAYYSDHIAAPNRTTAMLKSTSIAAPLPSVSAAAAAIAQEKIEHRSPPRVTFEVTAQTRTAGNDLAEINVGQDTRLRSGDGLRISLRSDRDTYMALFKLDTTQKTQLLFPHPLVKAISANHIQAGESIALPGNDLWYRLDAVPGPEVLLLIASNDPIDDLDTIGADIRALMEADHGKAGMTIHGVNGLTRPKPKRFRKNLKPKPSKHDPNRVLTAIDNLLKKRGIEVTKAVSYVHLK